MEYTRALTNDNSDRFIEVTFREVTDESNKHDQVYSDWKKETSHLATDAGQAFTNILRNKYPGWAVVRVSNPYMFPFLGYPDLLIRPIPNETMDTVINTFIPFARKSGRTGGILGETVKCGGFMGAWKSYDFLIYQVVYPAGMFPEQCIWVLHEGPSEPAYMLLTELGSWFQEPHDEVFVYDQGYWQKNHALYEEIKKARWQDVILKEEFKKTIQSDIEDFYKNEALYKELAIPWKRGLIFYGPAGNGKTISLKAAMANLSHPILYVRTLTNYRGDEAAMADIFQMARRFSPCLLVLEDIDSHINERNRSFFLNQLDGLDNNDGILLIATTNHLERLDGSVANRPSRFDRKYLFDDPNEEERRLYCVYWQKKLASNKRVDFPDSLVDEAAKKADGLSFAYIKEAFVSTLVLLVSNDELEFGDTLKAQIKELKDQVEHHPPSAATKDANPKPQAGEGAPSELGYVREVLQRLAGPDVQKSLTSQTVVPSSNLGFRRWI